jgi:hypothetical protein
MANEQSPVQTTLDSSQVLHNTHHQAIGVVKTMNGFLAGAVDREINVVTISATVDDFEFKQGATTYMIYRVTYNNAAHESVTNVKRTV